MLCTLIGAIILSINIQVGLNMQLYDDIGDALSSLRGSTSSLIIPFSNLVIVFLIPLVDYPFVGIHSNSLCYINFFIARHTIIIK